jgi:hypothetical protein
MNLPQPTKPLENFDKLRSLCETGYFQKSPNQFVNIYFFYAINGHCEQYKKSVLPLKLGVLTREDFMAEIISHRIDTGRRYNVSSIYSYKVETKENEIEEFVKTANVPFTTYTQVEAISFPPSLELFQHHNSVFVFLSSDQAKKSRKTSLNPSKKTLKCIN